MAQKVRKGHTQSGRPGYFTNGFLAWNLSEEEFVRDHDWHVVHAKNLGFEYEEEDDA